MNRYLILLILLFPHSINGEESQRWQIIAQIKPAVVLIVSEKKPESISGTGFIISEDGYILTNNHVIQSADKIKVYVDNKKEYTAKLLRTDVENDLAILKINASDLTTVKLGNLDTIKVGNNVVMTGYPQVSEYQKRGYSICASNSFGRVSVIRPRKSPLTNRESSRIETNIAISPGNSGGPLYLEETGEVIGVVFEGFIGVTAFAIPINIAKDLLTGLPINPKPYKPVVIAKPEPKEPSKTLTAFDYLLIGSDYCDKKDYNNAIDNYNKAIELDPNYADAFNNRGLAYKNKENYDAAIRDFNKAIELGPNFATAFNNRGATYYRKEDYDAAIRDFNKAIELGPNFATAFNNRGNAYADKGNYDAAIRDFTKAIELGPNFTLAFSNRGLAYADKGNYDAAIRDYTKAIELDPNFADAFSNRGLAYKNKENYDAAIRDYTKAIELDPNFANVFNNRGVAHADKKDYDAAIQDYNKAIELDPNYALSFYNRGGTHSEKKDYNTAIQDYNKAIELDPNFVLAMVGIGIAYEMKGDKEKAKQWWEKAIKKKEYLPDGMEEEIRQWIKELEE